MFSNSVCFVAAQSWSLDIIYSSLDSNDYTYIHYISRIMKARVSAKTINLDCVEYIPGDASGQKNIVGQIT